MRKVNQLRAGALLSYVSLAINNIISILYTPFMIRLLGQSEYGLYNLANSVIGYLGILDFGLGNAIIRYGAKYRAVEDKDGDTKDEASKISINKTITSRIESYGDIDYFSFVAGDNKDYSLTFKNLNMEYNGLSCQVLSKYDEVIGEGFVGYDQTQTLDLKNLVNGETYYIRTTSNSSGNYKIKVEPACKSLKDAGAVVTVKSKVKYNGKAQTPSVTIKVNNIKLKKGVDYRVKYTNNKKIGKATVKITGIGKVKGTITKTFKIVK